MNGGNEGPRPDIDDREWRLQERAHAARRCDDTQEGTAREQRYRAIAKELDRPLEVTLPSNFAYVQAQRIEQIVARRRRDDARFLRGIMLGAGVGYAGCIALAAFAYRAELSAWFESPLVSEIAGSPWWPWLLGCAGLGYLLNVRPRRTSMLR